MVFPPLEARVHEERGIPLSIDILSLFMVQYSKDACIKKQKTKLESTISPTYLPLPPVTLVIFFYKTVICTVNKYIMDMFETLNDSHSCCCAPPHCGDRVAPEHPDGAHPAAGAPLNDGKAH
jgi:hypothetical protein